MAGYSLGMPSMVLYGYGSVSQLKEQFKRLKIKKPLIVTDSFLAKNKALKILTDVIADAGCGYALYAEVNTEPTDLHVRAGKQIYQDEGCDSVISIGGGSPIDAAKGISIMATNPGDLLDYEGLDAFKNPAAPHIAITTTAGTGSEASQTAILTEASSHKKMLFRDPELRPVVAVCDAQFTVSLPKSLTASTGYDSLAHAVEAYVSKKRAAIPDIMALGAIELISKYLVRSYNDGADIEAREGMLVAELLAGIAFGNSSTASAHGLARPFGGFFGVPHGLSVSLFLPEVIRFNMDACPDRYAKVAVAMGIDTEGLSDYEAGMKALEAIEKMRSDINIPTLSELGIDLKKYESLIEAMADSKAKNHDWNPKVPTRDEIIMLYKSIIK